MRIAAGIGVALTRLSRGASGGGGEPPGEITDLVATSLSDTQIALGWTPASGATSHQYRIDGGSPVAASGPPMTVSGLTLGTEYDFEVRGVNATGNGAWSNVATETTDTEPPPIPSNGLTLGGESLTLAGEPLTLGA